MKLNGTTINLYQNTSGLCTTCPTNKYIYNNSCINCTGTVQIGTNTYSLYTKPDGSCDIRIDVPCTGSRNYIDENGTCQICPTTNVLTYTNGTSGLGTCIIPTSTDRYYTENNIGKLCSNDRLYINQNGSYVCLPCDSNTRTYLNNGVCTLCNDDAFFDPITKTCTACSNVVRGYVENGICKVCDISKKLENGVCSECLSNPRNYLDKGVCKTCETTKYLNKDTNTCEECNDPRNYMDQNRVCQYCNKGDMLKENTCTRCSDIPRGYKDLNGNCQVCPSDRIFENGQCKVCGNNEREYVNENGVCSICSLENDYDVKTQTCSKPTKKPSDKNVDKNIENISGGFSSLFATPIQQASWGVGILIVILMMIYFLKKSKS